MSASTSSFSKTSSRRLLNSSVPGKYDGNPANLPDYFRAVNADLAADQINIDPARPYCMRNLNPGEYLTLADAEDKHEYKEIAAFHKELARYNHKQITHLEIWTQYLSIPVFEDIRAIHDHVNVPTAEKITQIKDFLNNDANSKSIVAIQLVIKEI